MDSVVIDSVPSPQIPWILATAILFGSAIISWAFVEAVKKTALNKLKMTMTAAEARKSLWWTPMLIVVSMIMGFSVGSAIGGVEWTWLYGGLVGTCGGALASFLVSLAKGHLQAFLSSKLKDDEDDE